MVTTIRNMVIALSIALLLPILLHLIGHSLMTMPAAPAVAPFTLQPPAESLRSQNEPLYREQLVQYQEARRAYERPLYAFEDALKTYHRHALYIEAILALLLLALGIMMPWGWVGAGLIGGSILTLLAGHHMVHWYPLTDAIGIMVLFIVLLILVISPFIRMHSFLKD